jgi:ATP-binding cassette subfamily C protein
MKSLLTLKRLTVEVLVTSPYRALASVFLMIALSLTEGVGLLLLMPLLHLVGINEPNTMPNVAEWFETAFDVAGLEPTLGTVLAVFVGLAGCRALLHRSYAWVNASMREDVMARLRIRLYKAIAGAEWTFLVTRRPSEFVHALTGEIGRVGAAGFQVINLVLSVGVSLVYLGMAFHFSPIMAAVVLACAAVVAWAARGPLGQARKWGQRSSAARAKLHTATTEHMAGLKTARSYGAAGRHADIFVHLSHDLRDISLEVSAGETDFQQSLEFGSMAMLAFIVYVSFEVLDVTPAQLLVLLFVFARLIPRMIAIYGQVRGLAGVIPILDAVGDLERQCLEAAEIETLDSVDVVLQTSVRFEGVSFTYLRRAEKPAVDDLTLEIAAGLTTAIVGPSGAGKSTLADLLLGLLSPSSGRLLVDGQPLTAARLAGWRRNISYVPQETFLLHDTVRANLTWANPEATDQDLRQALQLAAAEDFVTDLPQGLGTVVGERGVLLSGGERQRLSLARALVRRPKILVLDEATSSLDSENERRIQQAVSALHRQMTIIIITHRLSTIRDADLIHVLDGGRLVESGSWDELVQRPSGRFYELCGAQGVEHRLIRSRVASTSSERYVQVAGRLSER